MRTDKPQRIGTVIFNSGKEVEITSIIDSSDSSGRTTTVRTSTGDIFVRISSLIGSRFFKMGNEMIYPDSSIKCFNLE